MTGSSAENRRFVGLLLLGAASAIVQTVMLREAMGAVAGNELVLGAVFAVWLVGGAIGAQVARHAYHSSIGLSVSLAVYASVGPLALLALRRLSLVLPLGQEVSFSSGLWAYLALLIPSSFLGGFLYSQLCRYPANQKEDANLAGKAYWIETLGTALAGASLSLFLLDRLGSFAVLGIGCGLCLAAASLFAYRRERSLPNSLGFFAYFAAMIILPIGLYVLPLDRTSYQWQVGGEEIIKVERSSRGAILKTRRQGQEVVWLNGKRLFSSGESFGAEQIAHLSLALVEKPEKLLIVGAVAPKLLEYASLHGLKQIDELTGDEKLAHELSGKAIGNPTVRVLAQDERQVPSGQVYDCILVGVGAPTTISTARLFSQQYYIRLRGALRKGGLVAVVMPGHGAFATFEQRRMHSTVANTLRSVFANVVAIPADSTIYLAGELSGQEELWQQIVGRLGQRGISSKLVSEAWLRSSLSPARLRDAAYWAREKTEISTDLEPVSYQKALAASLKEFDDQEAGKALLLLLIVGLIGLAWFNPRRRPDSYVIGTTGFVGLSLLLVLMFSYQSAVGGLYRDLALLNAAFMLSAAFGALGGLRIAFTHRRVFGIELAQILLAFILYGALPTVLGAHGTVARLAIIFGAVLIGLVTGLQVAVVSRATAQSDAKAGGVYAVDMAGAAIAAALTYSVFVPAWGLGGTCLLAAGVKGSSLVVAMSAPKSELGEAAPLRIPIWLWGLVAFLGIAEGSSSQGAIYLWSSGRAYFGAILGVLALSLGAGLVPSFRKRFDLIKLAKGITIQQLLSFLILLPVAVLPIARCYFKIPYVFCHNCPRPCAFGIARPYIVTSALLMNLGDHRFCERVCPLGLGQKDAGASYEGTLRKLGIGGWAFRIAVIALVGWFYFGAFPPLEQGRYFVSTVVLAVAGALLALSFWVRRPFCDGMCPIGGVSDLLTKGLNRKKRDEMKVADE